MADRVNRETRSKIMKAVGVRDTGAEVALRKELHAAGFRYRIASPGLPGKPDLVFPARRKVIFVHGCFWHGHSCRYGRLPKSRLDYWEPKIEANRKRDEMQRARLNEMGWSSMVVWECQIKADLAKTVSQALSFLREPTESEATQIRRSR